jgi:ABC-2 type transport system ATP-binding protein
MTSPVISVETVIHRFKAVTALSRFSCEIPEGITGLLGPNGAGKTTLMRLLTGIYELQAGSITIVGESLANTTGKDAAARLVGYLPQTFGVYGNFTLKEFITYFGILHGVSAKDINQRVEQAVSRVGLQDRLKHKMKSLSGGMVRRAGIAQALAHDPKVLILDEPTAGLDPDQRYRLRETLRDIAADTTILISTHLSEDIAALGGNVLVMNEGQLRFSGRVRELEALAERAKPRQNDMRSAVEKGYSVAQDMPPMVGRLVAAS